MKKLVLRKDYAGQFYYSIVEDGETRVSRQYGYFDRDSTIAQATERFGKISEVIDNYKEDSSV